MLNQTSIIVLKKQPYQEANLLLNGITPDFGRMSLILYGAQKIGDKKFPVADIFQEFDFSFEDNDKSALHIAKDFELSSDNRGISDDASSLKFAGRMGKFLLNNSSENLPMPFTYDAAKHCFIHLAKPKDAPERWSLEECAVIFKLTFLYENGYLPEITDEKQSILIENIISSGMEGSNFKLDSSYCHQLNLWLNSLLDYHKIVRN